MYCQYPPRVAGTRSTGARRRHRGSADEPAQIKAAVARIDIQGARHPGHPEKPTGSPSPRPASRPSATPDSRARRGTGPVAFAAAGRRGDAPRADVADPVLGGDHVAGPEVELDVLTANHDRDDKHPRRASRKVMEVDSGPAVIRRVKVQLTRSPLWTACAGDTRSPRSHCMDSRGRKWITKGRDPCFHRSRPLSLVRPKGLEPLTF